METYTHTHDMLIDNETGKCQVWQRGSTAYMLNASLAHRLCPFLSGSQSHPLLTSQSQSLTAQSRENAKHLKDFLQHLHHGATRAAHEAHEQSQLKCTPPFPSKECKGPPVNSDLSQKPIERKTSRNSRINGFC